MTRFRMLAAEIAAQVALALAVGIGASLVLAGAALLLAGATAGDAQAERPPAAARVSS